MAVSLVRTTLTVQAAATSGPARRLATTLGCWFTPTRVLFQQERGSIRSVSLCTKWPSDGYRQTFGCLSKRRLCCSSDGLCDVDVRNGATLWLLNGHFAFEFPNCCLCHWVFVRPSSMNMRYRERSSSLTSEANPGAESVRMTVEGPASCLIPTQGIIIVSCRVSRCSFSIMHVTVYDVTHSRTTKINCRSRLMTSAA